MNANPRPTTARIFCHLAAGLLLFFQLAPAIFGQQLAGKPTGEFSGRDLEWFEREVRPVLAAQCYSCHSSDAGVQKGGLLLDSRQAILTGGDSGPAVIPGKPESSLLVEAIRRESYEMPPEKPLEPSDRRVLERWVELGAPWPTEVAEPQAADWFARRLNSHWAWQPVQKPDLPSEGVLLQEVPQSSPRGSTTVQATTPQVTTAQVSTDQRASDADVEVDAFGDREVAGWSRNPIDHFVLRRLRENSLTPTHRASGHVLLRRLSYDLTGLPPTQFSLAPFGERLTDAEYATVVDRLLASPQFGVACGRHWLDLVRYAETLGHEFDYPLHHAWRYRDAVIDAFNIDLRYDRFVREHIAGDQMDDVRVHPTSGVNQSLLMTGFWWLGDSVHAPTDIQSDWATRVDNQIDVVSKTFMGMTVACARCHDHKFDAIRMRDYYGLAGMVESTRRVYAITDPNGRGLRHQQMMQAKEDAAEAEVMESLNSVWGTPQTARRWVEKVLSSLSDRSASERQELLPFSHLFACLLPYCHEQGEAEQDSALLEKLLEADCKYREWQSRSPLLADFSKGLPQGWRVDGVVDSLTVGGRLEGDLLGVASRQAENEPRGQAPFDWYTRKFPVPLKTNAFSSQRFGLKQQVVLQSPVFTVEYPLVCMKMRGKSAQSALVIDNYFMNEFHQLLFSDTRKPLDQPHEDGWWIHSGDLQKYLGQTAYLSLEDFGDGWFEIEEVRFSKSTPPEQPSQEAIKILQSQRLEKARCLDLVSTRLTNAFQRLRRGEYTNADTHTVRQALLLAVALGMPPTDSQDLASFRSECQELDASAPEPTLVLAAVDSTPRDTGIALRGNPKRRGQRVPRLCLSELSEDPLDVDADSSGRWELAESLAHADHPLTARVIVNRVWHHLMGRGIVASTDNLGVLGGRPTHPELLDHLAFEFVRHDWSLKWLIREIVMSQTYQLSSQANARQLEIDPTASLYSYRGVRRLSAESIRDSLLAAAGEINLVLGGQSIPVHLSEQMTGRGRPRSSGPLDGEGRRSVFLEVRRNFLNPLLLAFDFPMPATAVGNRTQSNVPAQALGLLNAPLVDEMSERCVSHQSQDDASERVEVIFRAVYGRQPNPDELKRCLGFVLEVGEHAWSDLVHTLFNSKEFLFLR